MYHCKFLKLKLHQRMGKILSGFWILMSAISIGCTGATVPDIKKCEEETCSDPDRPGLYIAIICENLTRTIDCPDGKSIELQAANYGRFGTQVCIGKGKMPLNPMCSFDGTLRVLTQICDGDKECKVEASNEFFSGDPCPSLNKYLEIHWLCTHNPVTTTTTTTTTDTTVTTSLFQIDEIQLNSPHFDIPGQWGEAYELGKGAEIPSTATITVNEEKVNFCSAVTVRNALWPKTELGQVARVSCPKDTDGYFGEWKCNEDGTWTVNGPDLSRCKSKWLMKIVSSLNQDSVRDLLYTIRNIQKHSLTDRMYGGDAIVVAQIIAQSVRRFDQLTEESMTLEDRLNFSTEISNSVVMAVHNLLKPDQREAWNDLPNITRQAAAARLIQAVERSMNTLAEALKPGSPSAVFTTTSNVLAEVSSVTIHNYVSFPSPTITFYDPTADIIQIPSEALNGRQPSKHRAQVVYILYDQLSKLMKPRSRNDTDSMGKWQLIEREIVSKVLTVSVPDVGPIRNLQRPVVITFSTKKTENHSSPVCAWYDRRLEPAGQWSEEGCRVHRHNSTHTVCSCNHLTHFAVLMDVRGLQLTQMDAIALTFLTYAGCVLSVVCLFVSLCSFQFMSSTERLTIHKNLCFSLLVAELIFLFGIWQTGNKIACGLIAASLHYLFLAAFCWMLLEGVELFYMLIVVFPAKSRTPFLYAFGYGFPLVVVAGATYLDRFSYGTTEHCWLRTDNDFIWSFVGPAATVLFANGIFLIMTLIVVCRHSNIGHVSCSHHSDTLDSFRKWLKGAAALTCLLGLTWTFGLFWVDRHSVIFAYLFTAFNSLQGLFIFLFHVAFNDNMAKLWQKRLSSVECLPFCMRRHKFNFKSNRGYMPAVRKMSSSQQNTSVSPVEQQQHKTLPINKQYPNVPRLVDSRCKNENNAYFLPKSTTNKREIISTGPYDYATICYGEMNYPFSSSTLTGSRGNTCPVFGLFEQRGSVLQHTFDDHQQQEDSRKLLLCGHPKISPPSIPPPSCPPVSSLRPVSGQSTSKISDDSAYSDGSSGFSGSILTGQIIPGLTGKDHFNTDINPQLCPNQHSTIRMDLNQNPPVFVFPANANETNADN